VAVRDLVSVRYAKALFKAANATGRGDQLCGRLQIAAEALAGSAAEREFWTNPLVSLEKKRGVLERAIGQLGDECAGECERFLKVLLKNGRMEFLPAIARVYAGMCDEAAGRVCVQVRTAMAISDEEKGRLAAALGKVLGAQAVLEVAADAGLLAGIVVTVRDARYDGSARGRLERFLARLSA
jgi:F-type H+-transporting ATPase subunit delta